MCTYVGLGVQLIEKIEKFVYLNLESKINLRYSLQLGNGWLDEGEVFFKQ